MEDSAIFSKQDIDTSTITGDLNLGSDVPSVSSTNEGGILSWMQNNFINLLIITIILAFLGFNLFTLMGETTDMFVTVVKPIAEMLGFTVGETVKNTVDTAAKGTKLGVDVASGAIDDAINLTEDVIGVNPLKDKVNKAPSKQTTTPQADDATSKTQTSSGNKKRGFCYIGEDRGFRSCIKVNNSDMCMSGNIFPTKEICENPSLRE